MANIDAFNKKSYLWLILFCYGPSSWSPKTAPDTMQPLWPLRSTEWVGTNLNSVCKHNYIHI